MKNTTLTRVAIILGMLIALTDIFAQASNEGTRRSLRGSSLSTPPTSGPQDTGSPNLDPSRAENGKPDPFGGAGQGENTDVDDPFANNPNGGAGEGENTDVDDPFANNPNGGAGEGENTDVDDPFNSDSKGNGGAGVGAPVVTP